MFFKNQDVFFQFSKKSIADLTPSLPLYTQTLYFLFICIHTRICFTFMYRYMKIYRYMLHEIMSS